MDFIHHDQNINKTQISTKHLIVIVATIVFFLENVNIIQYILNS